MELRFKTRFRYWQVLLGFMVLGLLLMIAYFISNIAESRKDPPVKELLEEESADDGRGGLAMLFTFFYYVSFFYFILNYYYHLIVKNKRFLSFLKITGIMIGASFIFHVFLYYCIPALLTRKYDSLRDLFSSVFWGSMPIFILSYLFAYITNMREAVKQRRVLEAQKLQLETQISQANFNFLKAQINPHFLHNTLNFLYAKSLPYSAELSEGILTLSDIMRYALSQGNQKDGKTPLRDEIEHVQNVIKISQLRFSNQLKVTFDINGNVNGKMIIPFVLITIVENAFKHGDLKNPDYPIEIKINIKEAGLYFYCRNRKRSGMKQFSTGIGLENIKQRLELAYGSHHQFIVKDEPEFYTTELIIDKL